jgi:hypothetical protein
VRWWSSLSYRRGTTGSECVFKHYVTDGIRFCENTKKNKYFHAKSLEELCSIRLTNPFNNIHIRFSWTRSFFLKYGQGMATKMVTTKSLPGFQASRHCQSLSMIAKIESNISRCMQKNAVTFRRITQHKSLRVQIVWLSEMTRFPRWNHSRKIHSLDCFISKLTV